MKTFLNGILAGIALGIAGTVNLMVPNKIVGASLFGFGLFLILCYQFKLYTGAIGYLATKKRGEIGSYIGTLIVIWLGNFAGTWLVGFLVRQTRIYDGLAERVTGMCAVKLADTPLSIFILAIFCGILMYVAVESFRQTDWPGVFRALMVFLCVSIFILAGFEHCIANMYYFAASNFVVTEDKTVPYILLMTLGNSVGGMLIPFADKVRK